jgi:hypothetical protein
MWPVIIGDPEIKQIAVHKALDGQEDRLAALQKEVADRKAKNNLGCSPNWMLPW